MQIYHLKYFIIISRFQKGLSTLGVLEVIRRNPETMKRAFVYEPDVLTAASVEDLFTITRSPEGTNKRRQEEQTLAFLRDLLLDLEGQLEQTQVMCIEVFSVLAIQKTFDQGSPFANYPLVGTFNHIHFGGKSLIMSGTRSK